MKYFILQIFTFILAIVWGLFLFVDNFKLSDNLIFRYLQVISPLLVVIVFFPNNEWLNISYLINEAYSLLSLIINLLQYINKEVDLLFNEIIFTAIFYISQFIVYFLSICDYEFAMNLWKFFMVIINCFLYDQSISLIITLIYFVGIPEYLIILYLQVIFPLLSFTWLYYYQDLCHLFEIASFSINLGTIFALFLIGICTCLWITPLVYFIDDVDYDFSENFLSIYFQIISPLFLFFCIYYFHFLFLIILSWILIYIWYKLSFEKMYIYKEIEPSLVIALIKILTPCFLLTFFYTLFFI